MTNTSIKQYFYFKNNLFYFTKHVLTSTYFIVSCTNQKYCKYSNNKSFLQCYSIVKIQFKNCYLTISTALRWVTTKKWRKTKKYSKFIFITFSIVQSFGIKTQKEFSKNFLSKLFYEDFSNTRFISNALDTPWRQNCMTFLLHFLTKAPLVAGSGSSKRSVN